MPTRTQGILAPPRDLGAGILGLDIRLAAAPEGVLAGQYLLIFHPDGTGIPFSIASAPRALPDVELHYRPAPGSDDARRMDDILARPGPVTLELPCGDCGVSADRNRPLVMIAGGTGIAQARSIARQIAAEVRTPLALYWGARSRDALYLSQEFDRLSRDCEAFRWVGAVEEAANEFRSGLAGDVVAEDIDSGALDLSGADVLLCGGPPMVWAVVARLRPLGLQQAHTFSDVFAYAPREDIWSD